MPDISELIKTRRSVRRFTSEPIDERRLELLLEAMRWAPTAGNAQPLRFYVVRDDTLRRLLMGAALNQRFIAEAPTVIVVAVHHAEAKRAYGARGVELYCLQDAAAATQNLLLTAHSNGLASCWVGAFDEARVSEVLELARDERPVVLIPLGVAADKPATPRRRPLGELVTFFD